METGTEEGFVMQDDLTILYYTANRIDDGFASRIRQHLHQLIDGRVRIMSVSQKPIDFGDNICVGEDIGYSAWVCYYQILQGAKEARTPFVACAEDDSLYTWEHFGVRPPGDSFHYNKNRWILEDTGEPRPRFRWRDRTAMCGCVAPTELLIRTLEEKFSKFPDPIRQTYDPRLRGWGEPGRYERVLHLPQVGITFFETELPILTLNHKKGLGGLRRPSINDKILLNLPPWDDAKTLWKVYHG